MLEFRVLGPLEVLAESKVLALEGRRPRALLALLCLRANEVVTRERLIDALWGERPPKSAPNALQVYVHALRKALGRDRLVTRGSGYALRVEPGELDLERFEALVREGTEDLRASRAEAAASKLESALALWRGPALAGLGEEPFAPVEIARLETARLDALEARIEADLAAGRHDGLVGELEWLVAEHPFRERPRAQLMLALYRSGRQAEALAAYQEARRALVEELGVEPGPGLQELERQILRQAPELEARTTPRVRTNLPAPPTSLIGRELELASTAALLRRDDVRLLTLCGPGGTGKTRLALALATEALDAFESVFLVELASVGEAAFVPSAVASALGLAEQPEKSLVETLAEHLGPRRCLLVLDNFEHLVDAAPLVGTLLAAAPDLKALATSRSALRISAEHVYPVPPLALPDAERGGPETMARNEAVRLFVARARAVAPGFRLTETNAASVAEICRAVDGLPLAIELAAARIRVLDVASLRSRLGQRLDVLTEGPRDAPARHRTLRATIDWSYGLLGPEEQRVFACLAVFAGGCTLEDAESVGGAALETLAALIDESLLVRQADEALDSRWRMLETIRELAAEKLEERGEADAMRRRHAEHFLHLAEEAEPELTGKHAAAWLARLEKEHDNFRAALGWAAAEREGDVELRLAGALQLFWRQHGHLSEGRRWLEAALARGGDAPASVRAKAFNAVAVLVDKQGEHARARGLYEEALALFRALGDSRGISRTLAELGSVAVLEGDHESATALYEETLPLFRAAGDGRALLVTLANYASLANLRGDRERGRALGEEALALARERRDWDMLTILLHNLGREALARQRLDEAARFFQESLEVAAELGYKEVLAYGLEGAGELAAALGAPDRAARLLGAGAALFDHLGAPLGPEERDGYERTLADLARLLGAETLERLRAEGRALALEAAIAEAIAAAGDVTARRARA